MFGFFKKDDVAKPVKRYFNHRVLLKIKYLSGKFEAITTNVESFNKYESDETITEYIVYTSYKFARDAKKPNRWVSINSEVIASVECKLLKVEEVIV